MTFKSSYLWALLGLSGCVFVGWNLWHYAFDMHEPRVWVDGIVQNGTYAGDVPCTISGSDAYGVSSLSVRLDGKPLITNFKVSGKAFDHACSVPTTPLAQGKHQLSIELKNATWSAKTASQEITFFVDNTPLRAALISSEAEYKVFQGRTLHVQFQANKEIASAHVKALAHVYPCMREHANSLVYEAFIPITCEEIPNEYLFTVEIVDLLGNNLAIEHSFQVVPFPFKKQTLRVSSEQIESSKQGARGMAELEEELAAALQRSPQKKLWNGAFFAPIDIKAVSTDFGTIRVTQERGRYMHKAVDVLNAPKSVVWATQDGIVVIKDTFEHSGKTVVIDHGYGIFSLFFHLHSFADIVLGGRVKQGNPIGTLGMTGYASGYHLHWEMRINNIPVDPLQWIKPNF